AVLRQPRIKHCTIRLLQIEEQAARMAVAQRRDANADLLARLQRRAPPTLACQVVRAVELDRPTLDLAVPRHVQLDERMRVGPLELVNGALHGPSRPNAARATSPPTPSKTTSTPPADRRTCSAQPAAR